MNRQFLDKHLDALDPVIGPRMLTGRTLSAPDYFALLRRYAALQEEIKWTLRDVDAFIVPTTMAPAWPLTRIDASSATYLDYNMRVHRNTGLGNVLNLCGVSVPCGFTSEGLPVDHDLRQTLCGRHGAASRLCIRASDRMAYAPARFRVDRERCLTREALALLFYARDEGLGH